MTFASGAETQRVPGMPNLVDPQFFGQLLYLEIQNAFRLRYPISLLCVSIGETPSQDDDALASYVVTTMLGRLRATDAATILSPAAVVLLLVDTEIQQVSGIFDRATEPLRHQQARRLVLTAGAASFPRASTNPEDLLRQALALMERAAREGASSPYLAE